MKVNNIKTPAAEEFPIEIKVAGVSAKIYRNATTKGGKEYVSYLVIYSVAGVKKQTSKSDYAEAVQAAKEACEKIGQGEAAVLDLTTTDRFELIRAREHLNGVCKLDECARDFAAAFAVLGGRVTLIEAAREWVTRNTFVIKNITVPEAVEKIIAQAKADEKSKARRHELQVIGRKFAGSFLGAPQSVTPSAVALYLSGLRGEDGEPVSERTKRNHKDYISHLQKWLKLHEYLAKDVDWLKGVQKYSKRKSGLNTIYTPVELKLIMAAAGATPTRAKWMVAFCAISAFSTIRHSKVKRLDWAQIDLQDKAGESFIEILPVEKTKASGRRRLIPINDTLAAWLKTCRQASGPVVPVADSYTLLSRLIKSAGVEVQANALRHSSISYNVALTGEVARIADESGNSEDVIRKDYLRRVKPSQAKEWFAVLPDFAKN